MADETTASTQETNQTPSAEGSGERTFTQAEVNELVGKARVKERSKYEGYVKADEAKSAAERAEKAEKELAQLRAESERAHAVSSVAEGAGVPAEFVQMLNGADEDELKKQVERIKKLLPAYPTRTDDGGGKAAAKKDNAQVFGDLITGALGR